MQRKATTSPHRRPLRGRARLLGRAVRLYMAVAVGAGIGGVLRVLASFADEVSGRMDELSEPAPPERDDVIDYVALFSRDKARARAARRRARMRRGR